MLRILMNKDYFLHKNNAQDIIDLQRFLINKKITQENVKNRALTRTIMRQGTSAFADRQPMTLELDTFQNTIRDLTVDYLKKTKLFRINHGILVVACVEHHLCPGQDSENYKKIYSRNELQAIKLYDKLRGYPETTMIHSDATVRSAKCFFNCEKLLSEKNDTLEAIRSYLNSIEIDEADMEYITRTSIQLIDSNEVVDPDLPLDNYVILPNISHDLEFLIDKEFFRKVLHADDILYLVNYLKINKIKEEELEDNDLIIKLIVRGMVRNLDRKLTSFHLDTFRNTLLDFTLDYLKTTKLFRINHGILLVACIEYCLFPGRNDHKYRMLYRCDPSEAIEIFKKLCWVPEHNIPEDSIISSIRSFFMCKRFAKLGSGCLASIRAYLRTIKMDYSDKEYIMQTVFELIKCFDGLYVARAPVNHGLGLGQLNPKHSEHKQRSLITEEYFHNKNNAVSIIKLKDFLNNEAILEGDLDNVHVLTAILQKMKISSNRGSVSLHFDALKSTIRDFTLDNLKRVNLYRINHGILAVACVERYLYPDESEQEYMKIYRCSAARAASLYNELCGYPVNNRPNDATVKAAKHFFRNNNFIRDITCLELIRSYLNSIEIDDQELQYIKQKSSELIYFHGAVEIVRLPAKHEHDTRVEARPPRRRLRVPITREYFRSKINADAIVKLINYLKSNKIEEKDLEDINCLIDMLQTMRISSNDRSSSLFLKAFKNTLLDYTVDYLKVANLYQINHGILLVACVEYHLYPGKNNDEHMRIYRCDRPTAIEIFERLYDFAEQNKPYDYMISSVRSFFKCNKLVRDHGCLETIRSYLRSIEIDDNEINYIKQRCIDLIDGRKDLDIVEPPASMPIENYLLNLPWTDQLQPCATTPNKDAPLPVVRAQGNHGFHQRYSPNQIILAKKSNFNFQPELVSKVRSNSICLKFFPQFEETAEVTPNEDVKDFAKDEIDDCATTLTSNTLRKSFVTAVELATMNFMRRNCC